MGRLCRRNIFQDPQDPVYSFTSPDGLDHILYRHVVPAADHQEHVQQTCSYLPDLACDDSNVYDFSKRGTVYLRI